MKAYQTIAAKYNLKKSDVKKIYETYLNLIKQKAYETYKKLKEKDMMTEDEMYYDKGNYCFYLRYLGKYFINHKAYLKWKSKILKQSHQGLTT